MPAVPLALIVETANALASDPALRRRLAVLLAYDQGWRSASWVAAALGITGVTSGASPSAPTLTLLRVARLVLGDPRLRFRPFEVHIPDISGRSRA